VIRTLKFFIPAEVKKLPVQLETQEDCLRYLAEEKWRNGYICRKCGNTNYCGGKTAYSRRCTRCKHEESATANTIFHRCHLFLPEAFRMVNLVCSDPEISSYELSRHMEIRQMTCWKLKKRLMECLKRRGEIDLLFTENSSGEENLPGSPGTS